MSRPDNRATLRKRAGCAPAFTGLVTRGRRVRRRGGGREDDGGEEGKGRVRTRKGTGSRDSREFGVGF